jgi:hypothetical protein
MVLGLERGMKTLESHSKGRAKMSSWLWTPSLKFRKTQIDNLAMHLMNLEKQEQAKPKSIRW